METNKTFLKKNTITAKIVLVAVLILLMLIPISMIKSMIKERESNKTAEQKELGMKWGGRQLITGPILVLPYYALDNQIMYAYILPDEFDVDGDIKPEERTRGIQKVLSYQSTMRFEGKFNFPSINKLNIDSSRILWNKSFFQIGITNLQGIKNKFDFKVNNQSQNIETGVKNDDITKSGLTITYPLNPENKKELNFNFDLTLNGTDGLHIIPIGKQTHVHLISTWKSVSYIGEFVPTEKMTGKKEINAQWDVYDYNRNYTQTWLGSNTELQNTALGINFLLPVDHYQKTMRSVKYAIMFIALTFLVFFMIELLSKKRIHPIQYLLVSFALILFYSMLLAFSEHIGFGWSYLLSAIAIIGLITAYSKSIFQDKKQTVFMAIFLVALYVFLYVVIQLEDMALLLGTIGLFVALAIVMYTSRKVNWYKEDDLGKNNN